MKFEDFINYVSSEKEKYYDDKYINRIEYLEKFIKNNNKEIETIFELFEEFFNEIYMI